MSIQAEQFIKASVSTVWDIISDIENCDEVISGIKKIKVLHQPEQGILGLKWEETREMFGKEAIETMWISAVDEPNWYETTAHNHGSIYTSKMAIVEHQQGCTLSMQFSSQATTMAARLMSIVSILFSVSLKKMISQDLLDIKRAAEAD